MDLAYVMELTGCWEVENYISQAGKLVNLSGFSE